MSDVSTLQPPATGDWEAIISRIQRPALLIGAIGLVLSIIGLFLHPDHAYRSYLWAFLFWAGISLGSLGFLMIQHLTGGMWGYTMRRFLEASAWLLALVAIFAIPVLLVVLTKQYGIYPWIETEGHPGQYGHFVNPNHLWFKKIWLSPTGFVLRTILYFAIWIFLSQYLYIWSGKEDRNGSTPRFAFKGRVVAAPGLVIYVLAIYFAFIDWVMTLDPQWYSTMFGVLYLVGGGLTTMAFTIVVIALLSKTRPMRDILNPQLLNDLGNLTFAFLLLWAYTNFSQFLIMWSGNIAEEMPYYYYRIYGSWGAVAIIVVVFHFFTPFLLLLWRKVKRDMKLLALVAVGILVVRSVDLYWIVKPIFNQRAVWMDHGAGHGAGHGDAHATAEAAPAHDATAHDNGAKHDHDTGVAHTAGAAKTDGHSVTSDAHSPDLRPGMKVNVPSLYEGMHWTDLPAWLGIGGIWVAAFGWKLKQRPLLAPNDPRVALLNAGHH